MKNVSSGGGKVEARSRCERRNIQGVCIQKWRARNHKCKDAKVCEACVKTAGGSCEGGLAGVKMRKMKREREACERVWCPSYANMQHAAYSMAVMGHRGPKSQSNRVESRES